MEELNFPVLRNPPPPVRVDMETYLDLVTQARDLVRDKDALMRKTLSDDIPTVRFKLDEEDR